MTDERAHLMRLSLLPLVFSLLILTGCQHYSVSSVTHETDPMSVPQGHEGKSPVNIDEAKLPEHKKIFPFPFDAPEENGGQVPSVSDAPQQADVRNLPLVLFPYDRWTLTPHAKKVLERAGAWLRTNNHGEITVEGHTDPKGTTSYNFALGLRRAYAVKRYLVNLGVAHKSMVTTSFGETRPVCQEASAYCDAMNRRATVFVIPRERYPLLSDLIDFTGEPTPVPTTTNAHDSIKGR